MDRIRKGSSVYGNTSSQYNVGVHLYKGEGTEINKPAAFAWIFKADQKNHPKALSFMGYLYESDEIVERNMAVAENYYRKTASLGDEYGKERLEMLQ